MLVITKEQIRNIVKSHFFYVEYKKKNGDLRTMNAKLGVKKHLKGGKSNVDGIDTMIPVYDMQAKGYRTLNLDKIEYVVCGDIELGIRSTEVE
jgi:hypothetical protein